MLILTSLQGIRPYNISGYIVSRPTWSGHLRLCTLRYRPKPGTTNDVLFRANVISAQFGEKITESLSRIVVLQVEQAQFDTDYQ